MKRVFLIISLFIGFLSSTNSQTIINENDINTTDSTQKVNITKQKERNFTKIKIQYFNDFEMSITDFYVWKDSLLLIRELGGKKQEKIIKNPVQINGIINYIFYFFVEKNKYIVLNPRQPGQKIETEKVSFDINIFRKGYNTITKRIIVEPDFTYSEEFMEFLKLLDSL